MPKYMKIKVIEKANFGHCIFLAVTALIPLRDESYVTSRFCSLYQSRQMIRSVNVFPSTSPPPAVILHFLHPKYRTKYTDDLWVADLEHCFGTILFFIPIYCLIPGLCNWWKGWSSGDVGQVFWGVSESIQGGAGGYEPRLSPVAGPATDQVHSHWRGEDSDWYRTRWGIQWLNRWLFFSHTKTVN